jgi:hypothetical protein
VVCQGKPTELSKAVKEWKPVKGAQPQPKGQAVAAAATEPNKRVFIVYGHDTVARDALELVLNFSITVSPAAGSFSSTIGSSPILRMHVVKLGEEAMLLGRAKLLELLKRLAAQIAAIHQEENTPRTRVLDEPIDEVASRVGLPATAGHLDQGSRSALGQGLFQVADRRDLGGP